MSRLSETLRRLAHDMEDKPDGTAIVLLIDGEERTLTIVDKEDSPRLREFLGKFHEVIGDGVAIPEGPRLP